MRKTIALIAILCLTLPAVAGALSIKPSTGVTILPQGEWSVTEADGWVFETAEDLAPTDSQGMILTQAGLEAGEDGVLPRGSVIPRAVFFLLYPGTEMYYGLPDESLPGLTLLELTGEWYYSGTGELSYKHKEDYPVLTKEQVFEIVGGKQHEATDNPKTIYLTIDDCPSPLTMDFLAVLDRLDVKATFFVVGAYVKQRPLETRAIHEEGHVIANHSYSHNAEILKKDLKNCLHDFARCEEAVAEALGFALDMPIIRIPYGSSTIPEEYKTALQKDGYMWIDWNSLNGDTEDGVKTDQDALDRAFDTAGRYDGDLVMLVHDNKRRTIRTMEEMVLYFREQGYEFRTLDVLQEKIPGVRMGLPRD